MKKYGLYVRCSTVHNINGLESQKDALINFLKNKGIGDSEYTIYEDKAISGAKESRPALNRLMEDVRNEKIHSVIVASFSRFARSTSHLLGALSEFNKYGVHFTSLAENIETHTPIGKMVFTLVSAIAEFERNIIQERVKRGLDTARRKGKRLGRPKTRNSELIQTLLKQKMTYEQISKLTGSGHWSISQEAKLLRQLENKVS